MTEIDRNHFENIPSPAINLPMCNVLPLGSCAHFVLFYFFFCAFHISHFTTELLYVGCIFDKSHCQLCDVLHCFCCWGFFAIHDIGFHFYSIRFCYVFLSNRVLNFTHWMSRFMRSTNKCGNGNGCGWRILEHRQMGWWIVLIVGLKNHSVSEDWRRGVELYEHWHFGQEMLWIKVNSRFAFVFSSKFSTIHYFALFFHNDSHFSPRIRLFLLTSFTCF